MSDEDDDTDNAGKSRVFHRHFSLSTLSRDEIINIVGTEAAEKKTQQIKTYLDKTRQWNRNVNTNKSKQSDDTQGAINNKCSQIFDELANPDDVFKPKQVVQRTPPIGTKRHRSNSSPDLTERQKIRKENSTTTNMDEINSEEKTNLESELTNDEEAQRNLNIQESLVMTLEALETINDYSEKPEILTEDGKLIRKASFLIHKMVTNLAYRIGEVQKENYKLASELSALKATSKK